MDRRGVCTQAYKHITLPGRVALVLGLALTLGGCSSHTGSMIPSFGFASGENNSPDCTEIQSRMNKAKKRYASVLGREKPAVYLGFTGNLSRTMKRKKLKGVHELTDLQLDEVVDRTRQSCLDGHLPRRVCRGAKRIGKAYLPMVIAAREAHRNYCGDRPIR